jgi:hypothetical protein
MAIEGGTMSNHTGSYMLNEVLELLEKHHVFDQLGRERRQQVVLEMVELSRDYNCNPDEILYGIGERLGICFDCLKPAQELEDGDCRECRMR